jgi:hypothetical protein
VAWLIANYGADTGLPDWKDGIAADCPLRLQRAVWDLCGAHFADLPSVMPERQ